ncbi:MAG: hypothetical protein ACXADH_07000 [Candidatus Kariarchaeaceae archaeon]|jgi:hypothetical protein
MIVWIDESEWYPCYDVDKDEVIGRPCELTEEEYKEINELMNGYMKAQKILLNAFYNRRKVDKFSHLYDCKIPECPECYALLEERKKG